MAEKDPNQAAAEKLDRETKKFQEEQKRQFDMPRKNMPTEDDMGPLPEKNVKKGIEQGLKGMGGKSLGLKKGGSASARADGCAIRGKTKA
jgi:hypothetical protein